jgi:hypothetical protein
LRLINGTRLPTANSAGATSDTAIELSVSESQRFIVDIDGRRLLFSSQDLDLE